MTPLDRPPRPARVRLPLSTGALVAAVALAPLLFGSVLYTQHAVRAAGDSVLHAEAEAWSRRLGSRIRPLSRAAVGAALEEVLEDGRDEGLVHVAHLTEDGRAEAGPAAAPYETKDLELGRVDFIGRVVRFAVPGQPPRPPHRHGPAERGPGDRGTPSDEGRPPGFAPGGPRERGPRAEPGAAPAERPRGAPLPPFGIGPDGRPWRPQTWLVVEFEPRVFSALVATSQRTLAIGALASLAVLVLAGWVWHSTRRRQEMEQSAEKARHLASLGEMSAVLAHEIRNPLASLKGHAQLLAERVTDDPRTAARVRRVVDEALRLETLTNHLLDFARSGEVHPTPTSPARILEAAAQATAPERITCEHAGAPASWPIDEPRMQQVLVNLLDNALAVTPAGARVVARVEMEGAELCFSICDQGPGIPAEERARIFEPFHTTKLRGTGLGLAVARRIVELHGGRLEVDDVAGGGAAFRVRLPA